MVEREDRAPVGTFYAPGEWDARVELGEAAAHHAGVKRLAVGDVVRLTSGGGRRATGAIVDLSRRSLVVSIDAQSITEENSPAPVEFWAPVGDRDRMLMLAEKAVELGVSAWRPVSYARSRSVSPRGEGDAFHAKLRLRMIAALEQSGGAWLPTLHDDTSLEAALADQGAPTAGDRLLLDGAGESNRGVMHTLDAPVTIAVGPEGGLTEDERALFIRSGWRLVSLGAYVLRFETAGIAALAIVRSHLDGDR
ncbi:MAG: 16S rRNA (uracil(1498)-N(3))-methyltransferase [Polaromonas sp.]|nr:16S rRNA (uracil(1498)-N(3))-methyltransferase [Gemmatimonadaceae bacterium]